MVDLAAEFADVFKSATKDLHTEKKRRERDARTAHRQRQQTVTVDLVTLKEAVFACMAEAVDHVSGNGTLPYPVRNLYYAIRPLVQRFTDEELKYGYFSQTLVTEYQNYAGPLAGMYRDPRGEMHEPHTGNTVRLGTREVEAYQLPEHVFDKILYVEKEGLVPIFKASKLGERYDLAIAAGKGQPVEAVRELFKRAEAGEYRLFVLHDADPAGYSIARTISEATRRMPGYSVDVVDLGLTVEAAIERDLPTETFTRRKALPHWMPPRLSEPAEEWFEGSLLYSGFGRGGRQWECTRVELNAFSAPGLVAYIEEGLAANDATAKVVPPQEKVTSHATSRQRSELRRIVEEVLHGLVDISAMVDTLAEETSDAVEVDVEDVTEALADNPPDPWGDAVDELVDEELDEDQLRDRARELFADAGIGGGE